MTGRKGAYFRRVSRSLGACQFVEFELKHYIAEALELAKRRTAGQLPFGIKGSDYEHEPLGRLITIFGKLSNCPALVKRLETFSKERNFVAHRSIATCIDHDGELDHITSSKFVARLAKIEEEAKHLTEAIHEEALKFRAHLDFFEMDRNPTPRRGS
jgi:hypothetical protein